MSFRYLSLSFLWGTLIWHLTTSPQTINLFEPWYQAILMFAAHFSFFGILAVLLFLARFTHTQAVLLTSLYGLLIEAFQLDIPGHTADPLDFLLDVLGALVFLFLFHKVQSSYS